MKTLLFRQSGIAGKAENYIYYYRLTLERFQGLFYGMKRNKTMSTFLRSSQLAKMMGISTDTLRHYERKGLLKPSRAPNGYREFPAAAVDRVRLIRNALAAGFSLEELTRLLKVRDEGGAPCHEVQALARAKFKSLGGQIRKLSELRRTLGAMLGKWNEKLAHAKKGEQAGLLDMLSASISSLKRADKDAYHSTRGTTPRNAARATPSDRNEKIS